MSSRVPLEARVPFAMASTSQLISTCFPVRCQSASITFDGLLSAIDQEDGLFRLKREFCSGVEFRLQDVRYETPAEEFHLVLCRNLVFTYFDATLQREILGRVCEKLIPGGFFVKGKTEPLPELPPPLVEFQPRTGIYQRKETKSRKVAMHVVL